MKKENKIEPLLNGLYLGDQDEVALRSQMMIFVSLLVVCVCGNHIMPETFPSFHSLLSPQAVMSPKLSVSCHRNTLDSKAKRGVALKKTLLSVRNLSDRKVRQPVR